MVAQIKQCQIAITNNLHYATKSESFKLQVKKRPIDGQHMGVSQCIAWNYETKVMTINYYSPNSNLPHGIT
jgi:hypothetical protein